MPQFRVDISATAIVESTLIVRADSPEDASDEALKRIHAVAWNFGGLDDRPVNIVEVVEVDDE